MGQIPYRGSTDIRLHRAKYSSYDNLAPRIYVPLLYIIKMKHTVEYGLRSLMLYQTVWYVCANSWPITDIYPYF